jgi:chemotaxis family two-component system response regulator Rcp1
MNIPSGKTWPHEPAYENIAGIDMSRILEILLVEDSLSDRFLALEALSEANILNNVHAVEDGVQALDFVRRSGRYAQAPRPDLILLDLNLPRKDGRKVLAELKAEPTLRKIPVIILATSGDAEEGLRAYPEHAQSYITKPIDLKQFNEVIRIFQDLWFPDLALPPDGQADGAITSFFTPDRSGVAPISPRENGEISPELCALSSMLSLAPDEGLVVSDARGNTLWVNEAFTRMCGYNTQELLGRNSKSLLHGPQTDQAAEARMRMAEAGGRSCTEEIVNYHKDGHPYRVRLMINPLSGPDGIVRGFLAVEQQVREKHV